MFQIEIANERIQVKEGTTLAQLAQKYEPKDGSIIMLAYVDGRLRELFHKIKRDCKIQFVTNQEKVGYMTYQRSVNFLFLKACEEVFGKGSSKYIFMDYSISDGTFCELKMDGITIDCQIASEIQNKMIELVKKDLPIMKTSYNTAYAREIFAIKGMKEKERLLKYRRGSRTNLYAIGDYENYLYGFMAPSTGYLKRFLVTVYDGGLILQVPKRKSLCEIKPFCPQPKLLHEMKRSRNWYETMGVDSVGALNDIITKGEINQLILVQEALQEKLLSDLADDIVREKRRIVLIAGPSSSGKTTFSHRLAIQLKIHGITPHPIALDDYFVDRELSPKDENGNYNFESIASLNLELFNRDINDLLAGKRIQLPTYNFITGKSEYRGHYMQIGEQDILVIEGIHGLNAKLSDGISKEDKYKIYVSALSQINIDEHNRIPSSDGRLLRRIVRDSMTRGNDARETIARWDSVRDGEEKNIFPYQEEADMMFNSAQIYELAVLKQYAEPLLFAVSKDCPEYQEAKRLLKFLDYFLCVKSEDIPKTSLLREFIGGSCFET